MIIARHVASGHDFETSGELHVLNIAGPDVRTFIDVGANRGNWTRYLLSISPEAQGILVEPSQSAFKVLIERYSSNPAIRLIQAAAGAFPGVLSFAEEPHAGETSSLVAGFSRADSNHFDVGIVTIDALLSSTGWDSCDFLKIDAEGYDGWVIEGAAGALADHRIKIMQFEYNGPWSMAGRTLQHITHLLSSHGYSINVINSRGVSPYDYAQYGEFFGYANFLAVAPGVTLPR